MGLKKLQAAVMNDPVAKMEYNKLKHQDTLLQMLQVMRTEAGLTQEVIAQRMGTRPSHVSRLEKGGTNPSLETLRNFAAACDCELTFSYYHVHKTVQLNP